MGEKTSFLGDPCGRPTAGKTGVEEAQVSSCARGISAGRGSQKNNPNVIHRIIEADIVPPWMNNEFLQKLPGLASILCDFAQPAPEVTAVDLGNPAPRIGVVKL
jgi:hypothetical protein